MSQSIRPVTSKPRGICKYHTTDRGCFSGDKCKFLHVVSKQPPEEPQLIYTPYDQAKRCKYFDQGYCKRGENCWFLHKSDKNRAVQPEDEEDEYCSICFEKPAIYGLLGGCSHVFCLSCIKQWRDPQNKTDGVAESGNTKRCPMCRTSAKFITPSSKFWKEGTEEKQMVMKAYMASMAKVPCRYFQKSLKDKVNPICPYGRDCFYSHMKDDGTLYVFKDGVDVCMKKYRKRSRRAASSDLMSALHNYLSYSINRSDPTSDHPTAAAHYVSANDTPAIHRQHNSDHGNDEDRWRLQEAMIRSLEILRGLELTETGLTGVSEDEREDEVIDRLEMMADQMLASANAARDSVDREESPHAVAGPSESEHASSSRTVHDFSGITTNQLDYDSDSDMPALKSLSDSEDDESDDDSEATSESSENSRPSDAFTTDGRGRVISVGDSTSDTPTSVSEEPESSTAAESASDETAERLRGGFVEWIESFFATVPESPTS